MEKKYHEDENYNKLREILLFLSGGLNGCHFDSNWLATIREQSILAHWHDNLLISELIRANLVMCYRSPMEGQTEPTPS